jgi:orotate phosphoribosyltransferase
LVFFHLTPFGEMPVNSKSLIRYFLRLFPPTMTIECVPFLAIILSFVSILLFALCSFSNSLFRFVLLSFYYCRMDGKGGVNFDVVFGPAYKGISLGAVVCASLYSDYGIDVGFAYDRKEAKDHGEGGKLVGASMSDGKRVLVVDDVITAGTAIRQSHTMLESIGAKMVGVVIALDRAEKRALDDPVSAVQAVQRDLNVSAISIVSLPQLQVFLEKSPDYGEETLKSVRDYRTEYGV